ncbi:NAD(P)(+)--arginine ADP-ribosyltransferase 2-like [Numida meleagris]|uniref:NAD(P)(+)--arginine ADP-ribosyltransferase 2-like n=1 Tax=Numida meleagris TaxID=8996 RepID=UPI000B3DE5DE|nr:NAD(P)(+)--arginine ADP-ribosyltransferase 2-like [Numida meleagris]
MEHLALRWVLLAGTLLSTSATSSALHEPDLGPTTVPMDMAPRSFDDQYKGCRHVMWAKLRKLRHLEMAKNNVYSLVWKIAAAEWQKRWGHLAHTPQLRRQQAIAVLAYSAASNLYKQFNAATREGGRSHKHYLHSYPFKSLHFLLTEALRALRKSHHSHCYHVYRGIRGIRFTAHKGKAVRFGQFTSSSLRKSVAMMFGQDTFFVMKTCYGVPIKRFSFFPQVEEVLIPPFEVFQVTKIKFLNGRTVIHLRSKGRQSRHNCELLKGQGGQRVQDHQEMGLGHSPGWALHSLHSSNCSWWGSGHREGDPVPVALKGDGERGGEGNISVCGEGGDREKGGWGDGEMVSLSNLELCKAVDFWRGRAAAESKEGLGVDVCPGAGAV